MPLKMSLNSLERKVMLAKLKMPLNTFTIKLTKIFRAHQDCILGIFSIKLEAQLESSKNVLGSWEGNERFLREVGLGDADVLFTVLA